MKKVVFVCGTFDAQGGKLSSIGELLYTGFTNKEYCDGLVPFECSYFNGGTMADLEHASHKASQADAVIWLANVPNDHPKNCVRSIKVLNPKCVLVTSKRSVEKAYTLPMVVQHALDLHANLFILFTAMDSEPKGSYRAELYDPLGNLFYSGDRPSEFALLGAALNLRVSYLLTLQRMGTVKAVGSCPETTPDEPEFVAYVRSMAYQFAAIIPSPGEIKRFVGNASFRCSYGFPALRGDRAIYVSRRNVNKQDITIGDFVPIIGETDGSLLHCGDHKPSVDAPIQLRVFNLYPNLKYMIHGHVYLDGTPTTSSMLPCGALLEANEVWTHFPEHDQEAFALNLRGHGFIAGATSVRELRSLTNELRARPMPEDQQQWIMDECVRRRPVRPTK